MQDALSPVRKTARASRKRLFVRGARRRGGWKLSQIGRQVGLLQRAQFDTSVDAVFRILEHAFAAGKILRGEKVLGIISKLFIEKEIGQTSEASGKRSTGFFLEGREITFEELPRSGLCIDVSGEGGDEKQVLVLHIGAEGQI